MNDNQLDGPLPECEEVLEFFCYACVSLVPRTTVLVPIHTQRLTEDPVNYRTIDSRALFLARGPHGISVHCTNSCEDPSHPLPLDDSLLLLCRDLSGNDLSGPVPELFADQRTTLYVTPLRLIDLSPSLTPPAVVISRAIRFSTLKRIPALHPGGTATASKRTSSYSTNTQRSLIHPSLLSHHRCEGCGTRPRLPKRPVRSNSLDQ